MKLDLERIQAAYGLRNLEIISKLGGLSSNNFCLSYGKTKLVLKQLETGPSSRLEKIIAVAESLDRANMVLSHLLESYEKLH